MRICTTLGARSRWRIVKSTFSFCFKFAFACGAYLLLDISLLLKEPKIFNRPALGLTLPPVQRVSFPGVKRERCGVDHPPPSTAEVKERAELYLYSPSSSSWPVINEFAFTFTCWYCTMTVVTVKVWQHKVTVRVWQHKFTVRVWQHKVTVRPDNIKLL